MQKLIRGRFESIALVVLSRLILNRPREDRNEIYDHH